MSEICPKCNGLLSDIYLNGTKHECYPKDMLVVCTKLLSDLREVFASSRQGEAIDFPEGSRYITMSDTLAVKLKKRIDHVIGRKDVRFDND
jgi:hypothetical protein